VLLRNRYDKTPGLVNVSTIPAFWGPAARNQIYVLSEEAADRTKGRTVPHHYLFWCFAKAFRGELVPIEAELARREGRSYEPASALLERIRAERESSSGSSREPATSSFKKPMGRRARKQ
jgi:hypothetical protein